MAKYCSHCGKKISDNAVFCKYCGIKADADIPMKNENLRLDLSDGSVKEVPERPIEQSSPSTPVQPKKEGLPKSMVIVVIAAIALVALSLIVGLVMYLGSSGGGEVPDDTGSGSETAENKGEGSEETSTNSAKDNDVFEYNGHRYQVVGESMRWDEAKAKCESKGGHLVIVNDAEEQRKIEDFVGAAGKGKFHYWLGGTKESGEWKWINGEGIPMIGDEWGYQNWEAGKPNNNKKAAGYTGAESYLELQTTNTGSDYMKWNDIDMDGIAAGYEGEPEYNSTKYFGYICEWDE